MSTKIRQMLPAKRETSGSEPSFPNNLLADIARHQMALAVDGVGALCRSSEALRKIQQEAAHEAVAFHEAAAQKLFAPCQPAELVALQAELLRFAFQHAGRYWQQIAAQAIHTQVEMVRSVSHVLESEKDTGMKSTLEAFQAAMPSANTFFPLTAHEPNGQPLHS